MEQGKVVFLITLAVTVTVFCPIIDAFPTGASPKACQQMVPGHRDPNSDRTISPQESISPYDIVASGLSYRPGGIVSVQIIAEPRNTTFQGFMIQARAVGSSDPVGTFLAGSDGASKLITCQADGDSVTHTGTEAKQHGMTFMWQAPTASVGDVMFLLTVAQNHEVYWVRMESNMLTATASASMAAPSVTLFILLLVVTMATYD